MNCIFQTFLKINFTDNSSYIFTLHHQSQRRLNYALQISFSFVPQNLKFFLHKTYSEYWYLFSTVMFRQYNSQTYNYPGTHRNKKLRKASYIWNICINFGKWRFQGMKKAWQILFHIHIIKDSFVVLAIIWISRI